MTSIDLLRMAETFKEQEVIIPVHHDIWTNFVAKLQMKY